MPAPKKTKSAVQPPAVIRGDLNAPMARAMNNGQPIVFDGHEVLYDGNHWDVNINDRWLQFLQNGQRLVQTQKFQEYVDLLFGIFADAILPANPGLTREILKERTTPLMQRKMLERFFTWRQASFEPDIEILLEPPIEFSGTQAQRAM